MKELIIYIAKSLVDEPDKVEVAEIAGERTVVYELKVSKQDIGKVIGKAGKTAKAIRTIVTAASMKIGKRAVLEILEPS
ncbi:KH domain-containing protein [candidate division WOR-3 bacterium]|nr:KH domain-containing protein [candidate division WOR-3 bacterium]MCK4526694.1 KH domain-containing protein [candidate division WOR-3 bacterium]